MGGNESAVGREGAGPVVSGSVVTRRGRAEWKEGVEGGLGRRLSVNEDLWLTSFSLFAAAIRKTGDSSS